MQTDQEPMNKHIEELMLDSPKILESRVASLKAELARRRESLPAKLLAWVAVALSLVSIGLNIGFGSLGFILLSLPLVAFALMIGLSAWGLRSNLRNSMQALKRATVNSPATAAAHAAP